MSRMMTDAGWIDLAAPDFSDWSLWKLAAGLHRIPRWHALALAHPWSVLQHSLLVADLLDEQLPVVKALALLHDAHEAITGDIPQPVKALMGPRILRLQARLDRRLLRRFAPSLHFARENGRLHGAVQRLIAEADARAARIEALCLAPGAGEAIWPDSARGFGAGRVARIADLRTPVEAFVNRAVEWGCNA